MTTPHPDRITELAAKLLERWQTDSTDTGLSQRERRQAASWHAERICAGWKQLVPARFAGATVGDLSGSTLAAVSEWRADPTRNLVLLGGVGVGKTHAALAAARLPTRPAGPYGSGPSSNYSTRYAQNPTPITSTP